MNLNNSLPLAVCVAIFVPSVLGSAQETSTYPYAHIRYVEGEAQLQRAAEPEPAVAGINHPVTEGDRLWTVSYSRAEIELRDGSLIRTDQRTKADSKKRKSIDS